MLKTNKINPNILGGGFFLQEKTLKAVCKEIFMGRKILKTFLKNVLRPPRGVKTPR
jgi:hypothetical protein